MVTLDVCIFEILTIFRVLGWLTASIKQFWFLRISLKQNIEIFLLPITFENKLERKAPYQLTITCSKAAMETVENGVKYIEIQLIIKATITAPERRQKTTSENVSLTSFWCFYC